MVQDYQCMVLFWSEDLNEAPFADSPKNIPCSAKSKTVTMDFGDLQPGIPYSFKIMVWPKKLTSASSAFVILRERRSLKEIFSDNIVVSRYLNPRQTAETFIYSENQGKKSIRGP